MVAGAGVAAAGDFPVQAYQAYCQRYDLEHFFRFGKTKLLLDRVSDPLCRARGALVAGGLSGLYPVVAGRLPLAVWFPRPWERYAVTEAARAVPGPGRCSGSSSELFGSLGHRPSCPNGPVIPLGGRRGTVPVAVRANRWCSNAGFALKKAA